MRQELAETALARENLMLDLDIAVKGDGLYQALNKLSEPYRHIILLSYFAGMTDKQIGEKLVLHRATVQYKRISALKLLKLALQSFERDLL